ncbi:hypothetical protein CXG81DRAFT_5071, partial [Caulochytrium protostelioides]
EQYRIVDEKTVYKRYIRILSRTTEHPVTQVRTDWDIVGSAYPLFCVVFPFFTATQSTRLVREYMQGPNTFAYTLAAGAFEAHKHTSPLVAAQREMSEEARLRGGRYVNLAQLDDAAELAEAAHWTDPAVLAKLPLELKWGTNRFVPYLCIDPEDDPTPYDRDAEEADMTVVQVTIAELRQLILRGQVLLPSVQTIWCGLEWLR